MNQKIKYSFIAISLIFLMLSGFAGYTQEVTRYFEFRPGQEFIKKTSITSKGIVERGKQALTIDTKSVVTKSLKVSDSTANGYSFQLIIQDMDVVINTLGKELHYNSKSPIDPNSKIEKALKFMVDKPVYLEIEKSGTIKSVKDPTHELANDSLLAFAGIQPEFFETGKLFSLVGEFVYNKLLRKGYTWVDSAEINGQKMITEYVIEDLNDRHTIIKLKNTSFGTMINSNTTGTYIFDNKSGIITEKLLYTVSTGFRASNKILYGVSRSSSISETIIQKPPATQ